MEHKKQRWLSKDEGAFMEELPVMFEFQRQMIASLNRKVDHLTMKFNPGDSGIDEEQHEHLQDEVKILQTRNKALEDEKKELLQKIVDIEKAHDVTTSQYQAQVDRYVKVLSAQIPQLRSVQATTENILQNMPIALWETQETNKTLGIAHDSLGTMSQNHTDRGVSSGSLPDSSSLSLFRLPAKEPIRSILPPWQAPSALSAPATTPTSVQLSLQRQPKSHSQASQEPAPTTMKNKRRPKLKTAEEMQLEFAQVLAASYGPKQKTYAAETLGGEKNK
ncbi:MAG: hypothetical protein LQ337_006922 [Flavoplaca oasis]|nr:MAG: hypothetical protein LQ337_006922 [Flavoplaca oasis]